MVLGTLLHANEPVLNATLFEKPQSIFVIELFLSFIIQIQAFEI